MSGLTLIHVIISLIAIVTGIAVAHGFLTGKRYERTTLIYMVTTILTSLTGFLFPFNGVTPGIVVGTLCVLIFIPTALALYKFRLTGIWRPVYVVGALALLFFNCLVLIVQSFQKIPPLHALAPADNAPPVLASQLVLLAVIVIVGFLSVRRFRPQLQGA
ncbi:hypothetical protein PY650_15970 [Rhizobium calliandrae]|uniref:DUF2306 domain-containing protein n=1 Tax=Rhizobium calliandrae TaxID=1312182 RepID=A0ABT7KIW5_9HYPH|nr:hypothetical protein [Rhizobium calliandrae]MDL2407134.1 hypothetical protein [Rhizobium calliandrae]